MSQAEYEVNSHHDPMRAFAELSKIVLGAERLNPTLQRIAQLAKDTIGGLDEASITLMENDRASTVVFTGPLAVHLDERQYEAGFGPCLDAAVSGETIVVNSQDPGSSAYPEFSRAAQRVGIAHTVSVGLPVAQRVIGGLNLYGSTELPFDDNAVGLAGTYASYAAVAVANAALYSSTADLARHMQAAMQSRAGIEQAKGIIMAQQRCSPEEAFAVLVRTSQHRNIKLRDLAQSIITSTSAASPETSRSG
jgi:GAF domain-containing protein